MSAAIGLEVPFLTGRVNDTASLIDAATRERLEERLEAFEVETGTQVAVLTIPSLEGESLEEYSLRVAETWGLGREGIDDGVLVLVAHGDRKMRIEVGLRARGPPDRSSGWAGARQRHEAPVSGWRLLGRH